MYLPESERFLRRIFDNNNNNENHKKRTYYIVTQFTE